MSKGRFGTAISCMDGRVQVPVLEWLKASYGLDFVDVVTEPGADRVLSEGSDQEREGIRAKVAISVGAHGSGVIAVVGHHDCAGNPVTPEDHWRQVRRGIDMVRSWGFGEVSVAGLWIDENWKVSVVEPARV